MMKARFEELYRTHRDTVYNYLYYMCREEELAKDLAQETFLKIFQGMHRFRRDCSEKTWCLTIARNTFLSYARKKQPLLLEKFPPEQYQTWINSPEDRVIRQEEGALVRNVLAMLREEERTLLLLRDCEGIAYEEISRLLGITKDNVKVRLHRARKKYQKLYLSARDKRCGAEIKKTASEGGCGTEIKE